jgi:hypothetical protein
MPSIFCESSDHLGPLFSIRQKNEIKRGTVREPILCHGSRPLNGINKIMPPTTQHGAYSFHLEDLDSNWWEIQYVDEGSHEGLSSGLQPPPAR